MTSKQQSTEKGITHRTISGLLWMFSGKGIRAVLKIVVVIVLARLLTPYDFGLLGATLVVVGFAAMFSELGLQPAIVQRPILEDRHLRTGFTASVLFGVLLGAIVYATAPCIAAFFKTEELIPLLEFTALLFPIYGLSVVAGGLLQRELRFGVIALADILSYLFGFGVVGISFAILGFGVWSLIAAHATSATVSAAVLLIAQPHPKHPQMDRRAFGELMAFGGGLTIGKLFNFLARQGDNLVIGRWLGPVALGIYGRAYQLLVFPVNLFGSVLDKVLFPSMAKVQDDSSRLQKAYRRAISLVALLMAPISVFAVLLAPELIRVILGPQWLEVTLPFQILAVGMMFRASYKISDAVARATGAVYRQAWRHGVYAALIIGGAWIGQHWGIAGVSVAVLVALAVNFLFTAQLSLSLTRLSWRQFFGAHLPAAFMAAITAAEIWFISSSLRSIGAPALVVLIGSFALVCAIQLVLFLIVPRLMLGADGVWMVKTIRKYGGDKLNGWNWWSRRQVSSGQRA